MSISEMNPRSEDAAATAPSLRNVVFLAYPKMGLLDLSGAQTVFYAANIALVERGLPGYAVRTVSVEGGPIQTAEGLVVETERLDRLAETPIDTLLVPGTPNIRQTLANGGPLVDAVRTTSAAARRTASVCSGTFLLARAGLIDGLRVATHWAMADMFERMFAQVTLDREAIFVQQGSIWTSAGVSAGIDLALAMVEHDAGRDVAMQVARRLVVFYRRPDNREQWGALMNSQYSVSA
ncbi:DJ-1/PfpI family protein [Pseudomonas sp. KK4]|uniref:AraC family transcriptional regulator n=1 Tax=Pseudomonas sp. KK4 TaxID=1855729 RepID=UPI00097C031C